MVCRASNPNIYLCTHTRSPVRHTRNYIRTPENQQSCNIMQPVVFGAESQLRSILLLTHAYEPSFRLMSEKNNTKLQNLKPIEPKAYAPCLRPSLLPDRQRPKTKGSCDSSSLIALWRDPPGCCRRPRIKVHGPEFP